MNTFPLISVLLPLYNEPVMFAQLAIDSIRNQTYENLEIILLLDNPENVDLKSLMKKSKEQDERIKLHFNENNLGLPSTLNIGISLATGDFIARMDGDDISSPSRLETQLNYMLTHPNIDLVGTDSFVINEEGKIIGKYQKLKTDFSQKKMLRTANINLIHPTWFGKSELFKRCLYRDFMHCEDYDFMARAYSIGANFHNINEELFYCRVQQTSCRSVSRKFAYEQYINTLKVRQQLNDFLYKKVAIYPMVPDLTYDPVDKEKYQSTIPLLNQLREAFFKKNILNCLVLGMNIMRIDPRPLTSRLKVFVLTRLLYLFESLKLIR